MGRAIPARAATWSPMHACAANSAPTGAARSASTISATNATGPSTLTHGARTTSKSPRDCEYGATRACSRPASAMTPGSPSNLIRHLLSARLDDPVQQQEAHDRHEADREQRLQDYLR